MYLRYLANFYNETIEKEAVGFFNAADYLQKQGVLLAEDQEKLDKLVYWFDNELPIPQYYQAEKNRQAAKSATSWFKDSATIYIHKMNELATILTAYQVQVKRINSRKIMGKIIYEDDFQITVIPFRDLRKKVL